MERRCVLAALGTAMLPAAGCLEAPVRDGASSPCTGADDLRVAAETDEFVVDRDDEAVETLEFTLRNRASCPVTVVPSEWRIEHDGPDGATVARGDGRASERTLQPGETHQWSLSLAPHPTPSTEETTYIVAALEDGAYDFVVPCTLAGQKQVTRSADFRVRSGKKRQETRQAGSIRRDGRAPWPRRRTAVERSPETGYL